MAHRRLARSAGPDDARGIGFLERACPVRTAIDVISGRWKPSILEQIHGGSQRFSELAMKIEGISPQALAQQLRQLVADGVVENIGENAASLYRLTSRGEALAGIMDGLAEWGEDYLAARADRHAVQVKQS